ncbi:SDR family oxidoreductase [Clostridium sp. SHJSY1]|uniref:SDR family NAD(P)-dependent oxidoreductase n=1 Tax=Clostridium sp. SHJSY1 TaxID=2942483 RepID=UPI0028765812|nr:SDR family oxidoreductase [Clostridium sp. SHJSY1]MDS0525377.1 SDR family oxidoreductase [Clostridium sp. SHJSY1]
MEKVNRYTLITGGTEGLGMELAKLFAKDKHNLIIVARNEEKLSKVKNNIEKEFNVEVETLSVDLTVNNSCEEVYRFVEKNNFVVDNLINNAGVGSFGFFHESNIKREEKLIQININSVTKLTYYFLKSMIKRNCGGILNVASTAAFSAGPKMNTYYASKAYVLSLTESIYEEVKEYGVKVSCLCPGAIKTNFQSKAGIIKNDKSKSLLMSSKDVAEIAYKDFNKGRVIIIPGIKNKLLVFGNKLLPRSLVRKIVLYSNK